MNSAKRTNYEEDGCVGCGCVDGTWGVGDRNATRRASGGVNRVVAGAVVGNESEAGGEDIDEFLIKAASHLGRRIFVSLAQRGLVSALGLGTRLS